MTNWNSYASIRDRYNNMFDKAIKRLQKRCKHEKTTPGRYYGKDVEYCDKCFKVIKKNDKKYYPTNYKEFINENEMNFMKEENKDD